MYPSTAVGQGPSSLNYNVNTSQNNNTNISDGFAAPLANYVNAIPTYAIPSNNYISNSSNNYIGNEKSSSPHIAINHSNISAVSIGDTCLDVQRVISWASAELSSLDKNGIHQQKTATLDRYRTLEDKLRASMITMERTYNNDSAHLFNTSQQHKCQGILDEIRSLMGSLEKSRSRLESHHAKASERAQLLSSSHANTNRIVSAHPTHRNGAVGGREDRDNEHHQHILRKEREALLFTAKRLSEMRGESDAILEALKAQGNTLEGTANKLAVQFMESIGVSNQAVLQIVRRAKIDACIVYGGVILLLLFMLYIWFS
eukprot:Tbor_TRINITY_DN5016_c0_g1::TRINITY_DN5016_c0_g1_i1::g.14342::m.14342/K08496/GOSR2, BOS1; golgi SNAP receptor complex member 2